MHAAAVITRAERETNDGGSPEILFLSRHLSSRFLGFFSIFLALWVASSRAHFLLFIFFIPRRSFPVINVVLYLLG